MKKQIITIPSDAVLFAGQQAQFDRFGFVPAVRVGDLLFVSGQTALRADDTFPVSADEQTHDALQRTFEILRWVGLTPDHLIDIHSFHVDIGATLERFVEVKMSLLPDGATSWTATGVAALGMPGLLVEVRSVAAFA